jgi:hypothetical protein
MLFVDVERVGADVHEDRRRAAQHEAAAVQEKVKEGMMTLSPGPTLASSAASSSTAVLEWTISAQRA